MHPRERILTALDHREPDRVPIDIGSCGPTAIHVNAYARLRALTDEPMPDVPLQNICAMK